jgi:hypothetical protein
MIEVTTIDFGRLRISELIEYFTLVGSICRKFNPAEMNVEPQCSNLSQSVEKAEASFKLDSSSPITTEMVALDQARDQDIICLRMLAEGYTYHFDPAKKAAGQQILKIINLYGDKIYALNYESQTAVVRNLTNDLLLKPELVVALETTGMHEVALKARENNNAFSQKYLERIEDTANKTAISTSERLKESISLYRVLVRHLEANALLNAMENLNNAISEINKVAERFNAIIRNRQSAGKDTAGQPEQRANETA